MKNILIVEDLKLHQEKLKNFLNEPDYNIFAILSYGEKAVDFVLNKRKPDLIIMDIVLKGKMNGYEAARKILSKTNIPIIYLTGLDKKNEFNVNKLGAYAYLNKPFTRQELKNNINLVLYKHNIYKKLDKNIKEKNILLENIETQVWYLKDIDTYGAVNKAHADFLGFNKKKIKGRNICNFLTEKETETRVKDNKKVFSRKEQIYTEEWVVNNKGEKKLLSITKTPSLDENNKVKFVVCSAEDITEARKREEKIKYLSFHDQLTGLYNRRYFANEISRLNNSRRIPISIIIADMDGLKYINDNYGHKTGDKFIKNSGEVFNSATRNEDIVARVGGDEFAVILPETGKATAKKLCNRIRRQNKEFNKKSNLPEPLKISLGYSTMNSEEEDLNVIFNQADQKMYENKGRRRRKLSKNK